MDVIRKDATITNTDDAFPGSFEVILSAPTKDRDGETLLPTEWKQPLPDHITFDQDHGMSVASTVGSGVPRLEADGTLRVKGTYSSLPRAQEVRTLVKEGHINRTSVAFMSEKTTKDGVSTVSRELLNGAFVAIPANRDAVVLDAKGWDKAAATAHAALKAGRRNSLADQEHLDAIAQHLVALGVDLTHFGDATGGDTDANADVAAGKTFRVKDADTENASDPVALISATDAAIDQAIDLLAQVDATTLPAEVQQAIALIQAADATVDELLDALGIPDPDEDADSDVAPAPAPEAAKAASDVTVTAPPVEDDLSIALMAAKKRFYYATLTEQEQ